MDGDLVEQTFTEVATYVSVATEWGRAAALRTTLCLRNQTPYRTPHFWSKNRRFSIITCYTSKLPQPKERGRPSASIGQAVV